MPVLSDGLVVSQAGAREIRMATEMTVRQRVRATIRGGDLDTALMLIEQETARDIDHALLFDYAFLLWQSFEFGRATLLFEKLIRDPRTAFSTLQAIAKLYFLAGRYELSVDVMRIALDRGNKNRNDCLEQLAGCLERSNRMDEAIEVANLALAENPASSRATRLLAHIDKRNGRYENAVQKITDHLERFPGDWDWGLRYELAASLDRIGEFDQAWQALVQAKDQLRHRSLPGLRDSYRIRNRQGELVRQITDVDLKNWYGLRDKVEPRRRIALLAGFPRSGTTLLEQILTAHPDCVGTDESGILNTRFVAPIVWKAEDTFAALLEVRAMTKDQLEAGREMYCRYTEATIGESVGNRLLVEKDPLLTCDLALPLRLFPDASIIMPLRDPRDVAVSFFFTMVPIGWNSAPATGIVETARFYHDVMRHWLLLKNRLPWPTIETRYEDLVNDETGESKKLTDFLGLAWDDSLLDVANRTSQKVVSTPTYDDITRPIYKRAVNRWRNYQKFLEPALEILDAHAEELGYP